MLHPVGWSRRRVRRVSYLSHRAEIAVIFLAEASGFKGCWKPSSLVEISFVGVILLDFLQALQRAPNPASTPSLLFLSLQSWVSCCSSLGMLTEECRMELYFSVVWLCGIVFSFHFVLLWWQGKAGEATKPPKNGVTSSWVTISGVLSQQRQRKACFWISLLFFFATFVFSAVFMFCFFCRPWRQLYFDDIRAATLHN